MFKEILQDFIALSYDSSGRKTSMLRDILVDSYIIVRLDGDCTIHYLFSGTSIRIPFEWVDLFSSLNVHSGDRIQKIIPLDKVDQVGILFSGLCNTLNNGIGKIDSVEFLSTVQEIFKLGVSEFREYIKNTNNINLGLIELNTIQENKEI